MHISRQVTYRLLTFYGRLGKMRLKFELLEKLSMVWLTMADKIPRKTS